MKIGILAVQGAFIEHERMLDTLGVEHFEIRQKKDLEILFDGLIIPGGESTVMGKLLKIRASHFRDLCGTFIVGRKDFK
ncbi:MAG: Glutamine amidotransferase subunit pdxT [Oscillospiraceae bacterium]|nr:Glutamine amidotransferase subunit pdxT [Oscillospiraceae bacterium]